MLYSVLKILIKPILFLLFRIRVTGKENLDYSGRMIAVSNHRSNWDPILLALCIKPKVHYMAKAELFKFRPFGAFLRSLGAFPVARGKNDLGAITASAEVLKKGGTLYIFPEGARNTGEGVREFKPGAAVLALKTKTCVLPIALAEKPRVFRRLRVIAGQPQDVSTLADPSLTLAENAKKISQILHDKVAELKGSVNHS